MSNVIEKTQLICVAQKENDNHNKFWNASLNDDNSVFVEWGRVGKSPQSQIKAFSCKSSARKFIEKKCREKQRKGYEELEIVSNSNSSSNCFSKSISNVALKDIAKKQISSSDPIVADLMDYAIKVNRHQIVEASQGAINFNVDGLPSTALGLIGYNSLKEADALLHKISDYVIKQDLSAPALMELSQKYLRYIPTDIGMKKFNPQIFWKGVEKVQTQKKIIDSLRSSLDTVLNQPFPNTPQQIDEKLFDVKLELVKDPSIIESAWKDYYASRSRHHASCNLSPKQMWSVSIASMEKAYLEDGEKLHNKLECYHGSNAGNLCSILSKGFVIPPSASSHVTGRMFANGLYAAPLRHKGNKKEQISGSSTKALNYSHGITWGTGKTDRTFMFVVEFAMGDYYNPSGPMCNPPPQPYESTWAHPRVSGVRNHEVIVYRKSQCKPLYLIEFE